MIFLAVDLADGLGRLGWAMRSCRFDFRPADEARDFRLVCGFEKAFVQSAELGLRAGLDDALHFDGRGCVDDLDASRHRNCEPMLWCGLRSS